MVIFLHGRNEVDLRQPLISTSPASFIDLIRIPSMAHSSPLLMSETLSIDPSSFVPLATLI